MQKIISRIGLQNNDFNKRSILIKIILIFLVILSFSFISAMFIQNEHIIRYSLILFLIWTVSITLTILAKKGNVQIIAALYISFLLIMILTFSWTGGGIKGHGIKLLPIIVLFAGLTMGKKEIWVFGIIASLGSLILAIAEYHNLLPIKEPLGFTPLIYWLFTITSIFLLCILENLSVENLQKALMKSQEELKLRKKSEEALKLKNEKLMEIAQFQSHIVRGPIASMLGLMSLIEFDNPNDATNLEIILKLKTATEKVDTVIHQIVQKTNEIDETTKN